MPWIKGDLGLKERGGSIEQDALQKFLSLREDKQIKDQLFETLQESIQNKLLIGPLLLKERRFELDFSVIVSSILIIFAFYKLFQYRGNKNLESFKQLAGCIICLNFLYLFCFLLPDTFVGVVPFVLSMSVLPDSKVLDLYPVYDILSSPNVVRGISSCFFIFYGALSAIIFRFFSTCLKCNELLSLQSVKKYQNVRFEKKDKRSKTKDTSKLQGLVPKTNPAHQESVATKKGRKNASDLDFIKALVRYTLIVALIGFLPQKLVFNSTPMFLSFGKKEILEAGYFFDRPMIFSYNGVRWCLKLDHIFYVFFGISLYYHIIPKLTTSFNTRFSLLKKVLYTSLPVGLFICMWLVCFFKDLFLNIFILILLRKCGVADYILRPNNALTFKALRFLMTSTRFPDCVTYPTVYSLEESEVQLIEYFSYLTSNFYDIIILLTSLFFVVFPGTIWLLLERRASKSRNTQSKKALKRRNQ